MPNAQTDPTHEIAWGEDPDDLYRKVRFYLRAGERARLAVLEEKAHKAFVHYKSFYFYCLGEECPACLAKAPSPRYLTWVFVYSTTQDGQVMTPVSGAVKAWLFGRDKYGVLSQTAMTWRRDLRTLDMMVQCSDQQFQRMDITPLPDCVWQQDASLAQQVLTLFQQTRIEPGDIIAKRLTADRIRALYSAQAQLQEVPVGARPVQGGTPTVTLPGMSGVVLPQTNLADLLAKLTTANAQATTVVPPTVPTRPA